MGVEVNPRLPLSPFNPTKWTESQSRWIPTHKPIGQCQQCFTKPMEYAVKRGCHRHLQLLLRLLSHCLLYFSTKQDFVVGLSWCPVTVLPNSEACMLFVGQPDISTHLKKIWPNRAWYKFCCSLLLRPICFHRRGTYESLAIRDYHSRPDTIMVSADCWGMISSLIFS